MKKDNKKILIIAFGSQVAGTANAESDFDFAVLEDKPLSLERKFELFDYIEDKFKINADKIDIVDLSTASPLLAYEVAQKGRLVEGSDFDFIRFQVRAWKVYLDTAKFRRIGEEMVKRYVQRIHKQKA